MNFRIALGALAVAAAFSTPAFAQSPWYAGASVGQSSVDLPSTIGGFAVTNKDEDDTGYKLYGGYQFNKNFAVEAGWVDFGKASATVGGVSTDIKANGWNVSAVGILPLNDQWSLFAKLGTVYAKTKANVGGFSGGDSDWSASYGFGASYNISKTLAVRAEWEKYDSLGNNSDNLDVNLYTVGLTFKF